MGRSSLASLGHALVSSRWIANQKLANVGIYGSMLIYVLLWIFPDYQAGFLVFGLLMKGVTIPYFLRIDEKPVAQEAMVFMVGDLVGVSLNLGAVQQAASRCGAIFGI